MKILVCVVTNVRTTVYVRVKCMLVSERALYVGV